MKNQQILLFTLLSFFLLGCNTSRMSDLNRMFNDSQVESVKVSPFNSSKSLTSKLKIQKKFRDLYISKISQIQTKYPNNPIIVLENYDYICMGCPADYITFFNNKVLINMELDSEKKSYNEIKSKHTLEELLRVDDIDD